MVSKGSVTYRHNNTIESAVRIIEKMAGDDTKMTLDIQNQMVNESQTLVETAAGKELQSELFKERQKWAAELEEAREQMKEAIYLRDKESEEVLQEMKKDYVSRLERLESDNKRLHVDAERLHNERAERLEKALEQQRKETANILRKLQERNVQREEASKPKEQAQTPIPTPKSKAMPTPRWRELIYNFFDYSGSKELYNTSDYFPKLAASTYGPNCSFVGPEFSFEYALVHFETLTAVLIFS